MTRLLARNPGMLAVGAVAVAVTGGIGYLTLGPEQMLIAAGLCYAVYYEVL